MRAAVASVLSWVVLGCTLVSPLEPIASTRRGAIDEADAGVSEPPDVRKPPTGGSGGCAPARGDECDPVAQCGCKASQRCEFVSGGGARCFGTTPDRLAREGERCMTNSSCVAGLTCPATGLCSESCRAAADCDVGSCGRVGNQLVGESSQVCVAACDPLTNRGCNASDTCVPSADLSQVGTAYCSAIAPRERVARPSAIDEACEQHADCEAGLGCIATSMDGAGLCTPWCRANRDCPAQRSVCQLLDWYYASPGDPVGQCIPVQAGTTTDAMCELPTPLGWTGGPVWSVTQFNECTAICDTDPDCIRERCEGGSDFLSCLTLSLEACSGNASGTCRPEYVEGHCCRDMHCASAADVPACDQQYCASAWSNWEMCSTQDTVCLQTSSLNCLDPIGEL